MTHTHTVFDLERAFAKAARYAISEWSNDFSHAEDLKQKLWQWYLETPSTQIKLQGLKIHEVLNLSKRRAIQLLVKERAKENEWYDYNHYDTENVRDALSGKGSNHYLSKLLPEAFKVLEGRNESYAEAVRLRYNEGVVPKENGPKQKLKNAIKALTEQVNNMAITAAVNDSSDGPGSRSVVFPKKRSEDDDGDDFSHRRAKGTHSDPTAAIAIALIEHPELRDEYLHEDPITEYTGPRR